MDGKVLIRNDRAPLVDWLADDVDNSTEGLWSVVSALAPASVPLCLKHLFLSGFVSSSFFFSFLYG